MFVRDIAVGRLEEERERKEKDQKSDREKGIEREWEKTSESEDGCCGSHEIVFEKCEGERGPWPLPKFVTPFASN